MWGACSRAVQAFDPATYEREDETFVDENGRRRVRLAHNAVIRWRVRHTPDGRCAMQQGLSSARGVQQAGGQPQEASAAPLCAEGSGAGRCRVLMTCFALAPQGWCTACSALATSMTGAQSTPIPAALLHTRNHP